MKVDAVERLLLRARLRPEVLVELGCGIGAVIEECRRRGLAGRYVAVDASGEAVSALRAADPDIQALVADITAVGFRVPAAADVVLASHVIEHLEEPEKCLRNIRRSPAVRSPPRGPAQGAAFGRLKATLFRARRDTSAGHVQEFLRQSFERLVQSAGFYIVGREVYAPVMSTEAMALLQAHKNWSRWKRTLKDLTSRRLPAAVPALWSRFYHAHYAVLVAPALTPPPGPEGVA